MRPLSKWSESRVVPVIAGLGGTSEGGELRVTVTPDYLRPQDRIWELISYFDVAWIAEPTTRVGECNRDVSPAQRAAPVSFMRFQE